MTATDRRHGRTVGGSAVVGRAMVEPDEQQQGRMDYTQMSQHEPAVSDAAPDNEETVCPQQMVTGMKCAVDEAADLLRSIGSPYRLLILCLLMEREKTVSEICEAIGARQSLTSQHLTRLRLDGLVTADRRGHFVYYTLANTVAKDIVYTLYNHYCRGQ